MRILEILQGEARTRFLQGIAFGAVAAMTIGFMWGGWVTAGTAKTMTAMPNSPEQWHERPHLSPALPSTV